MLQRGTIFGDAATMTSKCDRFVEGTRAWRICTGQAELPERTINAYRARWGLPPLESMPEIERKPVIRMATSISVKPVTAEQAQQACKCSGDPKKEHGPGTELSRLLKTAGAPDCQLCRQLAKKMNQWGPDECESRMSEIIDDMLPRAKAWFARNRPWAHALLRLLPDQVEDATIRLGLQNLVTEAILNARRKAASANHLSGGADYAISDHDSNPIYADRGSRTDIRNDDGSSGSNQGTTA